MRLSQPWSYRCGLAVLAMGKCMPPAVGPSFRLRLGTFLGRDARTWQRVGPSLCRLVSADRRERHRKQTRVTQVRNVYIVVMLRLMTLRNTSRICVAS